MIILDVNKITKNYGYGVLFESLSFSLNENERISIVGPNGCGKSTLLKIIAGIERADSGQISVKKDCKIAYLDQTAPDSFDDRPVIDVLKDAFKELTELQLRIDEVLRQIEITNEPSEQARFANKYSRMLEQFQTCGGYDIETKIYTVCSGLNIPEERLAQNYKDLSGGEKTLIHLAKALLQEPDLFLLDEPTNHLDIGRIEWLEGYIKNFKGAVVIVSHDRYFLDRMSNKVLEIENGEATIYNTNYTGYLEEKEKNVQKQLSDFKDQQAYFKRIEEQIRFFAERGMATNSSTLTKKAAQLQSRLDREREQAVRRPSEQKNIRMEFDEFRKSSKVIIEAKNLTVQSAERKIINGINLSISSGERIAIIGPNGSGKSTFIKTLLGVQDLPYKGEIKIGQTVKIGYIPQIINFKNNNQLLLEYFGEQVNLHEQKLRSILAGFQFYKDDISKRVGKLSGGERIRLRLAALLQQQVNTLIFDEPTNHIDILTKETFEEALKDFAGTAIFVSHDRYFINKFAEKVIEFNNGSIKTYLGNYDDYKRQERKFK